MEYQGIQQAEIVCIRVGCRFAMKQLPQRRIHIYQICLNILLAVVGRYNRAFHVLLATLEKEVSIYPKINIIVSKGWLSASASIPII